jgi:hypothetical protein
MNRKFYAYLWLRENGTPYYVGKGFGRRAFKSVPGHRPPKDTSRIVILTRVSERAAIETEIEMVHNWGRRDIGTGRLYNRTDGGEGKSGYTLSEETRAKIGEGNRGKRRSSETRMLLSLARQGRKASLNTRKKLSAMRQGHVVSPECRAKLSAIMKMNEKVRTSRLGHHNTAEHNANISAGKIGHSVSSETRQKIRETMARKRDAKLQERTNA